MCFCSIANATEVFGKIEYSRLFIGNIPAYLDRNGPDLKNELDIEANFYLYDNLTLLIGIEAGATDDYFTQGGGKLGLTYKMPKMPLEFNIRHLSLHNFDHKPLYGPRFLDENRLGITYHFGKDTRR